MPRPRIIKKTEPEEKAAKEDPYRIFREDAGRPRRTTADVLTPGSVRPQQLWGRYNFSDYVDQPVKKKDKPTFYDLIITNDIFVGGVIRSALASGAPFEINSTGLNVNLNADLWDGYHFPDYLNQAVKTTSSPYFSKLGVGGAAGSTEDVLIISSTAYRPLIRIENVNDDANSAEITIYKNSASPATNDIIGKISFVGNCSSPLQEQYVAFIASSQSVLHAAEIGLLEIILIDGGGAKSFYFTQEIFDIPASGYVNFGLSFGSGGYGFRDNAGTMQYKNSGGSWTNMGGGGSPGGSDKQIQFNDSGSFGGDADFTWDKTTNVLSINGYSLYAEISAPGTPSSGWGALYVKTDGKIYFKNDGGTEYDLTATGSGSPGGSDTHVQFNDGGSFGGDAGFTYDKTTDYAYLAGGLRINCTSNAKQTIGETIHQGTNSDQIFAFKQTNVAHGATNLADTDCFAAFYLADSTLNQEGGLTIRGLTEGEFGLTLQGFVTACNTVKSTAARGCFETYAAKLSGVSYTNVDAGTNVFVVRSRYGGAWTTNLIVDAEGNTWQNGLYLSELASPPGTPSSGWGVVYVKSSDSKLYFKNDGGTEYNLTLGAGRIINVLGLSSNPTDASTQYMGMNPKIPPTTAGQNKVYIRESCTIKRVEIYTYASATAGTGEAWSMYIRVNNTTDYLVATVSLAAAERIFSNTGMSVSLNSGDYFEVKIVNPTWATNPTSVTYGGYVYLE